MRDHWFQFFLATIVLHFFGILEMDVTIRSKNIDSKLNNRAYEGVDSIIH